ncbi:MAG: cupin domain-containing protein [Verrucomicrobiota bacterium]
MAATRTPTERTASDALVRCVEPIDAAEFLADYWEQQPLAVPRAAEGRFDDLLSVADVERLVSAGGLRTPGLRLVKEGGTIAESSYTTDISWRPKPFLGVADPDRVAAAFADGATIVLQALHHTWPPLARFCRALEQELGSGVQANSYYTPRRSQGFAVHHDTHDVFVLQVAGEKHWRVYEPLLELPLKAQRWSSSLGEPGPTVLELTLRAGDTLYLPRGWLHDALTSETDSLHVTVGVNVHTWVDAFRAALAECEHDVEFRRSVPDDGEAAVDLVGRLAERLGPKAVGRRARAAFVDSRRPILDGHLEEVRGLESVTVETPLERRPTVIADLDGATLSFEGKHVDFPDSARDQVKAIFESDAPFIAADLPAGLDDEGRLVLVRRLIREGFLRRSAAGA